MPKIVRWICSGVQACMSCLKPPVEEGISKMKKRKRRHIWMVRKSNKVGPDPRKENIKTASKDRKDLPTKPKAEKPPKPKKTPPCEGCKPHSPRNIKARLGQKLKASKDGDVYVAVEDCDMMMKADDGDVKAEVGDGGSELNVEDDKSQEGKIAAYVASIVASALNAVAITKGTDELKDLKIDDDIAAVFTSNPDDASSVVSGDAKKGRESLVDQLISDLAAEYVGHGENFASETYKSDVNDDDQTLMKKSQNAQTLESGDTTQNDRIAPLPMSPLVGERPGDFRALRNKPPRSPKRHSSKA